MKPLASSRTLSDPGVTGGGASPASGLALTALGSVLMARETGAINALAARTSTRAAPTTPGSTIVTSGCGITTAFGEPSFGSPGGIGGTVITLDHVNG